MTQQKNKTLCSMLRNCERSFSLNFWDEEMSLFTFERNPSVLLLVPQCFGYFALRPSSCVYRSG